MMEIINIFSAFGLSASAGLNAYIPLLVVALLAKYTKLITLKSPWDAMTSWWVIGVLIFLCVIEIVADKVPAVNHVNDVIQSFVRPTAGAIVFAATASNLANVSPVLGLIAGLFVAGGVHAVKSLAVRPLVTATTGGTGNVPVSIAEDATSTVVSVISVALPVIAACIVVILVTILIARLLFREKEEEAPKK
jgi:uncharacterized membrane protein